MVLSARSTFANFVTLGLSPNQPAPQFPVPTGLRYRVVTLAPVRVGLNITQVDFSQKQYHSEFSFRQHSTGEMSTQSHLCLNPSFAFLFVGG